MKYMLMMHAPRGTSDWAIQNWPPKDIKAHIDFMIAFSKELASNGELVAAEGLAGPNEARIVRASREGTPVVKFLRRIFRQADIEPTRFDPHQPPVGV